jgi:transcriptional regulator
MYIPRANEETRLDILHDFMQREAFATLITLTSQGLLASHIPVVLEKDGSKDGSKSGSPFGLLRGHVARANPQWSDHDASVEALAVFSGPHHYITPNWYPSKHEDGKDVPTWNYVTVHAYGPLQIIRDEEWLMQHLRELTDQSEAGAPAPWKLSDAPEAYIRSLLNGIVGLELPISRLQGKWKVSQNRTQDDRAGVVAGLTALDTPASRAMKQLVIERS